MADETTLAPPLPEAIQAKVHSMLENPGFYIGTDSILPGIEVPFASINGRVFSMRVDVELDPNRFKPTAAIFGPFRGGDPEAPSEPEKEIAIAQAVELAQYVNDQAKGKMAERAAMFLSMSYARVIAAKLERAEMAERAERTELDS